MRLYLEPHKIGDDRCLGGWKLVELLTGTVCTHLS